MKEERRKGGRKEGILENSQLEMIVYKHIYISDINKNAELYLLYYPFMYCRFDT